MRFVIVTLLTLALAGGAVWAAGPVDLSPRPNAVRASPIISAGQTNPDDSQMAPHGKVISLPQGDVSTDAPPSRGGWIPGMKDDPAPRGEGSIDWANDILVRSRPTSIPTLGRLEIDHAANGDLYAGLLCPGPGINDTLFLYKSTNGGKSWTWWGYQRGLSGLGGIADFDLKVADRPGSTWIFLFTHYDSVGGGLSWTRIRPDLSTQAGGWIASGGDTIHGVSADRNIENPYHFFVAYQTTGSGTIHLLSSADSGSTWGNLRSVTGGNRPSFAVCAGGDGYVYICYAVDTTLIRVARYTNNLIGPSVVFNDVDTSAEAEFRPTVAAGRTAPGTSQTAWLLWRHRHAAGGRDLHYAYTTDGGVNWTNSPWPPTSYYADVNADFPRLRVSYDYPTALVGATTTIYKTSPDSVLTVFSRVTTPSVWEERTVINDHNATGEYGPKIDIVSTGLSGSGIIYRQEASDQVWFDYYANSTTGVEKGGPAAPAAGLSLAAARPNPLTRSTSIAFSLPKAGNAELAVYDIAGQKVATLAEGAMSAGSHEVSWNGANAPAGVYFYRLNSEGKSLMNRMVVVK